MDLNFSIGRLILLVYIIISSSHCSNLFSNSFKKAVETNRYLQHIILIILIMTLMIIFGNPFVIEVSSNHQINVLVMTLLVYIWFIMTTKLDIAWNIGILLILTIYFLYESKKISEYQLALVDPNLNDSAKLEIINYYLSIQKIILVVLFGLTTVGTLFYASEKKVQYGGGFSYLTFFFN
jgi:hypothetical protein